MATSHQAQGQSPAHAKPTPEKLAPSREHLVGPMVVAQLTFGNQGVLRRMEAGLRISDVNDPAEREAEHVGRLFAAAKEPGPLHVHAQAPTASTVQRKCACGLTATESECPDCRKKAGLRLQRKPMVQRQAEGGHRAADSSRVASHQLSSAGHALPIAARAYFEPRFGHDFSGVRVHTDSRAAEAARAVNALAYTVGRDIVFDTGQYAPASMQGRRLLAHELTHVVQQEGGARQLQRDINQSGSAQARGADPLRALLPQVAPALASQFSVRAMTESQFQAATGIKTTSIPEKRLLSLADLGLDFETGGGALAGISAGTLFSPRPTLPLPLGSVGVLWSADAHLSQFAVVRRPDPFLAFFFGDTTISAHGFRANAALHFGSAAERSVSKPGGPLTAILNRGAAGGYVSDAIFPYVPIKGGSVAVYGQSGAESLPGAQSLADCMAKASDSGTLKGTYTFSTPKRASPAYDRAFGKGAADNPDFVPPEIVNCTNEANATSLTRVALQGRDLVVKINGRDASVATRTYIDTGELVVLPGGKEPAGSAKLMRLYLAQFDADPSAQGLTRQPITPGAILSGVTGVIRVGGFVLTIVNLGRITDRYERATEYDKPLVVGEEATLLTAGLLGSLIGEAIGEAVLCVGAGPGFGLCVLAVGVVGGVVGSSLAGDAAHDLGQTLQDAAQLHREGKLLPGITEAATQVIGTEQQKKLLQDLKKVEKPQQSGSWFEFPF